MVLLAIDVGNTNTVLGIFRNNHLVGDWRVRTELERTGDEISFLLFQFFRENLISVSTITNVIISSVVPPINDTLIEFCHRYLKLEPLFISSDIITGIFIRYDTPREVGADRIVNAVAAYERYRQDIIVVDFGTATTFDCISVNGEYLGGAIVPGIMISCEALFQHASKLPRVGIFNRPLSVVAKDTVSSINVGILYGYAGLVDGLVTAINDERGIKSRVLATGGLAGLIVAYARTIDEVDDFLTLKGLLILYYRNR